MANPPNNANVNSDLEATTQAMYGMLTNVAFMIITNQVIKYFNLTDPSYLLYVRVGFAATQAVILTALFVLKLRIQQAGQKDGATVEVMEPATVAGQPATKRIMSPRDYDLAELSKQMRGVVTGCLFSAGLHYFFKSSHLLIIGSVNAVRALATSPLVKLYVFGQPAEGLLKRPFRDPPSPFGELFKQMMQPESTPAAAAAIKSRTGKKDDYSSSDDDEDEAPIKVIESEQDSDSAASSAAAKKTAGNVRQRKN